MSKKTVKVTSKPTAAPAAKSVLFQDIDEHVPLAPLNLNRLARLVEEIRLDLGYIKANLYLQARSSVAAALIQRGTPFEEVVAKAKEIVQELDPQLEFDRARAAAEAEEAKKGKKN